MRSDIATLAASAIFGFGWSFDASAQGQFPLVFESPAQLQRYGIGLNNEGPEGKDILFNNRCYYYGDGGIDISISDSLLREFKSQGFSRRSACMAIVSGIRFNPENGKRLSTYILYKPDSIKNGPAVDPNAVSEELPLSLPQCFKNAVPYEDCIWNYDPISGNKLSAVATQNYRRIGKSVGLRLSSPTMKSQFHYIKSSQYTRGMIVVGAAQYKGFSDGTDIGFYDYSKEFRNGYGYALYASGDAGPYLSPEMVKAAVSGKKAPSRVEPSQLKSIWRAGN